MVNRECIVNGFFEGGREKGGGGESIAFCNGVKQEVKANTWSAWKR